MPDISQLLSSLGNFGPVTSIILLLMWRDHRASEDRARLEREHVAERTIAEERRLAYDRERLTADKEMTAVLSTLAATIQAKWK